MKIYDTKLVIKLIKEKSNERIVICEGTLFEMMKNKTRVEVKRQFEHFYNYIRRTNSVFLTRLNNPNLFELKLCAALKYGRKLKSSIFENLTDYIFDILSLVLTLNMLFVAQDYKKTEKIINLQDLIITVQNAFKSLNVDSSRKELIRYIKVNKSEIIEDEMMVAIYNKFVDKINVFSKDAKFQLETISHFSVNEMIKNVDKKTREKYIEQFIDEVVNFKNNPSKTKEVYKTYLAHLYTKKMKIEINDFIDMNIAFGGCLYSYEVTTTDKNFFEEYKNLINITLVKE